jgi:hypothetical protein
MLAERTSDRVVSSGLILVDIAPKTNREGIRMVGTFMRSGVDGFSSLEDAAAIAAYTPQRKRDFNQDGLRKVLREHDGRS